MTDHIAAEFAAVREPLEQRIAQLEAALRECTTALESGAVHLAGHIGVSMKGHDVLRKLMSARDRARALLNPPAVTASANPGSTERKRP